MKLLPDKISKKYTERARKVLADTISKKTTYIKPAYLLEAILRQKGSLGANLLNSHNINYSSLKKTLVLKTKVKPTSKKIIVTKQVFSSSLKKVLKKSVLLAAEHGNVYIGTEHLLAALIDEETVGKLLVKCTKPEVVVNLRQQITTILTSSAQFPGFFSLMEPAADSPSKGKSDNVNDDLAKLLPTNNKKSKRKNSFSSPTPSTKTKKTEEEKGALEYFAEDLVQKARFLELDPLIGRQQEVERLLNILSRRTKNNPILIGEAGVGKTAIVHGLAQKIQRQEVPQHLLGKKLYSLDLGLLIAGTVFRGEFEGRLKDIIREAQNEGAIVFIDEIHTVIGAGAASGSLDAANILKPAISLGSLQIIGATTIDEYRRYIEKDQAFERRFQPIVVKEPTPAETINILKGLKKHFEDYHQIEISDEIIEKVVWLSRRYLANRFFPDKALDVLDEAAAKLRSEKKLTTNQVHLATLEEKIRRTDQKKELALKSENYEQATYLKTEEERLRRELRNSKKSHPVKGKTNTNQVLLVSHIEKVLSIMSGVKLEQISEPEKKKLLKLESLIKKSIIGQNQVLKTVTSALRRARSGIKEEKRPLGSFLFVGPSGVGKTELAKVLAQVFFEDPTALNKLDMSEFSESHTVSKILGSPPGYVGYEDSGNFLEGIRQHPYSLVLFDEIEKAHPRVQNLLLQILEDGELADAKGDKISFKHSIIILTSNLSGSSLWTKNSLGFSRGQHQVDHQQILKDISRRLKPELISRLDNVVLFKSLSEEDIEKIVALELKNLSRRLKEQGFKLTFDKGVTKHLAEKSYSSQYGARKVRTIVGQLVEDPLAQKIISDTEKRNSTISLAGFKINLSRQSKKIL